MCFVHALVAKKSEIPDRQMGLLDLFNIHLKATCGSESECLCGDTPDLAGVEVFGQIRAVSGSDWKHRRRESGWNGLKP